uniref:RNA polymerase sigma-70 domain-containing protein n=1 Tax=Amphora coffeiformis TaxID=265554 RepID=A0A7S3P237_9STRA
MPAFTMRRETNAFRRQRPGRTYNAHFVSRMCLLTSLVAVVSSFRPLTDPRTTRRITTTAFLKMPRSERVILYQSSQAQSNNNLNNANNLSRGKKRKVTPQEKKRGRGLPAAVTYQGMAKHDLLTRDQDQALGRAIQKATTVQNKLRDYLEAKRDELANRAAEQQESEEEWFALMGRGSSWQIATDEEEEEEDLSSLSVFDSDAWRYQQQSSVDFENILQATEQRHVMNKSVMLQDAEWDILSEDEIQKVVGMSRMQVESVLLEGAVARDTLVRSNVRLVVGIARKWCKNAARGSTSLKEAFAGSWDRPSLDEVIQEGLVGLITAADKYDPERNLRFTTYATFWVTNGVRRCFNAASTPSVRVPVMYYETRTKFKTAIRDYHLAGEKVPPLEQIAKEIGVAPKRLQSILRSTRTATSIDAPSMPGRMMSAGKAGSSDTGEEITVGDTLADDAALPEDCVELSFLRQSLEMAMANELAPFERDVLRLRLGLDDGVTRSCREVAEACGGLMTTNEVNKTEKKAFSKLRSPHSLASYKLLAYLDFAGIDSSTTLLD